MFCLTTHSTHFIYGYMASDKRTKEGNVLFNDALNTFYLQLYGVRHMVKNYSDSKRGNPLPPHGLLFQTPPPPPTHTHTHTHTTPQKTKTKNKTKQNPTTYGTILYFLLQAILNIFTGIGLMAGFPLGGVLYQVCVISQFCYI